MTANQAEGKKGKIKWLLNYIFIDGMSGMALGLFATLIAGTIVWEIGQLINGVDVSTGAASHPNFFGLFLEAVGKLAQIATGCGIGVGVCMKLKKTSPLVVASACAAGMIGSYSMAIIGFSFLDEFPFVSQSGGGILGALENSTQFSIAIVAPGDPMGAFIGALVGMSLASAVSGKTKVDILVTPLVGVLGGGIIGIALGLPVMILLNMLGAFISFVTTLGTVAAVIMGIVIAVTLGICLTLPVSSAALGIAIGLDGIAAGAAVVGCCCHMVGFAVMSFRENKWGGLIAQGIGTSMLQIPNVFKKPILFLPPIIASAVLGGLSVLLPTGLSDSGLFATKVGSGMGTAGLVGPIDMFFEMFREGANVGMIILWIALFCFVLPAAISLGISELMRKTGLIRFGDLKLNI